MEFKHSINRCIFLFMLLVGLSVNIQSCKSSKFTGETVKHETVSSGMISVKAGGYGSTKAGSVNSAVENAFKNIFLHGIPGTNQSTAMLGTKSEKVYSDNSRYFTKFMEKEKEVYILEKDVSGYHFLNTNTPSTEVKLLINLSALRSHLEQDGIIRAFGL